MKNSRPYLSVVASTRNDNHGGDLTRRSQIFVDALVAQAIRHRVEVELILVEWNPPQDRPPLAEELCWPGDNSWCEVRIITVAPEIHRGFGYSDRLPLFQMIAKNVGVRRAQSKFVLQTNIDIVLSDELFSWIAARGLQPGVMYRCDRVDIDRNVPSGVPVVEQLNYCASHVLRVNRQDGIWIVPQGTGSATVADARHSGWGAPKPQEARSGGEFTESSERGEPPASEVALAARPRPLRSRAVAMLSRVVIPLQERADRWTMSNRLALAKFMELVKVGVYGAAALGWGCYKLVRVLASYVGSLLRDLFKYLTALAKASRICRAIVIGIPSGRRRLRALGYKPTFAELIDELLVPIHPIPHFHTMACGDFMLTDIDSWHRMRATPELSIYSMYLDALALITAHKVGLNFQNLPSNLVIYHIDHGDGWSLAQHERLYRRMNEIGVPILSHATYRRYAAHLLTEDRYFLASQRWGLAELELPERTVTRCITAAPDTAPTQDALRQGVA